MLFTGRAMVRKSDISVVPVIIIKNTNISRIAVIAAPVLPNARYSGCPTSAPKKPPLLRCEPDLYAAVRCCQKVSAASCFEKISTAAPTSITSMPDSITFAFIEPPILSIAKSTATKPSKNG